MTLPPVTPPGPQSPSSGDASPESHGSSAGDLAGIGLQLAVCIIGGLYLGQWLDTRFGTAPVLLYVGIFGGFGAGFFSMYRKLSAANAREDAALKAKRSARP